MLFYAPCMCDIMNLFIFCIGNLYNIQSFATFCNVYCILQQIFDFLLKTRFSIFSLQKNVFNEFCGLSSESGCSSYFGKTNRQEPHFKCARSPQIQDYEIPDPSRQKRNALLSRKFSISARVHGTEIQNIRSIVENLASPFSSLTADHINNALLIL